MTDEAILKRLREGTLRIDPETAVVESLFRGKWIVLKEFEDKHESGYRFVKVGRNGAQKKIGVHRLQWMQAHDAVVPEGFDVHHVSAPPRPLKKCNRLDNLELLESTINQSLGYPGDF